MSKSKSFGYTPKEAKLLKRLDSPKKIQDFLETLKINFETKAETCYSPRMVMRKKTAHCMEGALFAAAALEFHGARPLVMDLRSVAHDFDHVIAVFKQYNRYGAISKTNHAVLRYREPVYSSPRELAMSFFHEYFDNSGKKTLRDYSNPFDLRHFDRLAWRTSSADLFDIPEHLDEIKHYKILSFSQIKSLRKADRIEIKAGKLVDYRP